MRKQPGAYHLAPFDHPTVASSFAIAGTGQERFPISPLPSGEMPQQLIVSAGNDTGYAVAVGDSTIDASTDPQFWLAEKVNAVCLNVIGMTHISVDSAVVAALTMSILGDGAMQDALRFDSGEEFTAANAATTAHTIAALSNGRKARYIALSTDNAGVEIAVGDSNVDANADPQFGLALGMDPVILDVWGMTTISVRNDSGSAAAVFVGYLGE